ncbi:MAG: TIGR02147 family protein, partial [Fibrobacteria bacterium]|nr:TIGR02147 family protein [Fibrobacteria bacterium]
MVQLPEVYQYFDYRKYLRDSYEAMREKNSRYSYRFIQEKTGIDPGFLVKVFNGQKNLTEKSVPGLAKLLKLNKRQTKYFTLLILFGRAKTDSEIKHYFEKLLSFTELGSKKITADLYE